MPVDPDDELLSRATPIPPEELEDLDPVDDELAPLEVDGVETSEPSKDTGKSKIQQFAQRVPHEDNWKRQPNVTGKGAIHVKSFVSKLRPEALDNLDQQVNEWLDDHPEYEVKFVTTAVGQLSGKTMEDALIMNIWV